MKRGVSLIELLLYVALLSVIVLVLYDLFAVAGVSKITEIAQEELSTNANRVIEDVAYTVKSASTISTPIATQSGPALLLNGGSITYALDANGQLIKTINGVSAPVHDNGMIIESITFTHLTPSNVASSVRLQFTAKSKHVIPGGVRTDSFDVTTSLRM